MPIRKAKAEPKCKFFAWTFLHKKILTTNNLMKRQWPNDPICKLCGSEPETRTHLCKDCVFSKQVWAILKQWLGLAVIDTMRIEGSLHSYWRRCQSKFDRRQTKVFNGIIIYFLVEHWEEQNRRTFQNTSMRDKWPFFPRKRWSSISWRQDPMHKLIRRISVDYVSSVLWSSSGCCFSIRRSRFSAFAPQRVELGNLFFACAQGWRRV